MLGMIHNGGNRKYIPVKPAELLKLLSVQFNASPGSTDVTKMGSCNKAFINVHSSTIDENLAAVCCSGTGDSSDFSNDRWYHSNLCHPRIPFMTIDPFIRGMGAASTANTSSSDLSVGFSRKN
jgi:hypothetical protein